MNHISRIATDAEDAVHERMAAYGHPKENHACTADLWNAYLRRRGLLLGAIDAEDVCWLNVLQKISRHANERKHDNRVDTIGFTINADMIARG